MRSSGRAESLSAAIEEVLDPAHGSALGRAARARCVERFGLDGVAERWAALLGRVGGTVR